MANKKFIESFNKIKEKYGHYFGWELYLPEENELIYNRINFNEKSNILSWGFDVQISIDDDVDINTALQNLYDMCLVFGYRETLFDE